MPTLNNDQAGKLFLVLDGWAEVKWKDPLVMIRLSRLKERLWAHLVPVEAAHMALINRFVDEYGEPCKEHGGKKALLPGTEALRRLREEEERLMDDGEFEVTESFRHAELVVRERDGKGKVAEYPIELSMTDYKGLGDLLVLDVIPEVAA